ncbi:MAG: hypothetical protein HMLKMBBP_02039 [Planctomycetes bacterium]|nr:hypothetical protein [Planctomycetota bacterium]
MRPSAYRLALGTLLAVGAFVRIAVAGRSGLWYDDIGRTRIAMIPWGDFLERLPWLDNLKSPFLVAPHKLWLQLAGTGSTLALRGWSVIAGVLLALAVAWVVRRAAGPRAALAAAALVALSPFHVRWSVEVHHYTPAALWTLLAWGLALGWDRLDVRRGLLLGAVCGLAVGTFPPAAFALLPLVLLPGFASIRGAAAAASAGAAVAAPALWMLWKSQQITGPALRDGFGWAPYFNPRKTPIEVLVRTLGLDVRQGRFERWWIAALAVLFAAAVVRLALSRERTEDPSRLRRRAALLASGCVALAALWIVSVAWVTVFADRYVHAAAATLLCGLVAALAAPAREDRRGPTRIAAWAGGAVVAALLGAGVAQAWSDRARFPADLTSRSYRAGALVASPDAAPPPRRVFVHGEAVASHLLLTSPVAGSVRHLTTAAWVAVRDRLDYSQFGVPQPCGWPFGAEVVAGRPVAATVADLRAALSEDGRVWVVFEKPPIVRTRRNEDEELETGVDAIWEACDGGSGSDPVVRAAAERLAGGPVRAEIFRDGRALLLELRRP